MRFLALFLFALSAFAGCEPKFEKVTSRSSFDPAYRPFVVNDVFWATPDAAACLAKTFGGVVVPVKTIEGPYYLAYDDGSLAVQQTITFKKGDQLLDVMDLPARKARVDFSIPAGILLDHYRKAPEKLFPEFKYTFGGVTYFWPSGASQRIRGAILGAEAENYGHKK